jgi:hypothetical protein
MSNTRKLRPRNAPAIRGARALAERYACGYCTARTRAAHAVPGVLLLDVFHDETCPVLRGQVSDGPDLLRAAGIAPECDA